MNKLRCHVVEVCIHCPPELDIDLELKREHLTWNLHAQNPCKRGITHHSTTSCSKTKFPRKHSVVILDCANYQLPKDAIWETKLNLFEVHIGVQIYF